MNGLGGALALAARTGADFLADDAGDVVVRIDVLDRLDDVGRTLASAGSRADRFLKRGWSLLIGAGGGLKRLPGLVFHGSQCLTVLNYGHGFIIHDSFVVWYHELSS